MCYVNGRFCRHTTFFCATPENVEFSWCRLCKILKLNEGPYKYRLEKNDLNFNWLCYGIMRSCRHEMLINHYTEGAINGVQLTSVFSCDQAALQMFFYVCPSVRPSVCLSHLFDYVPIIVSSWVITNDQSKVHAKGQGQRSKVKVTEVTTLLNRFRTVTPVWIDIWWWNDAYSLMLLRRCALLFFKDIRQISRSHGFKNRRIWPRLGVSGL